ncbi:hypothetical protein CGSMWGv75712_00605 [Gardnerella vaginalis 75712]|nr:hypothetical protein CGSMWGv75712_00605 [Gardnerella vaginalis 75712]
MKMFRIWSLFIQVFYGFLKSYMFIMTIFQLMIDYYDRYAKALTIVYFTQHILVLTRKS